MYGLVTMYFAPEVVAAAWMITDTPSIAFSTSSADRKSAFIHTQYLRANGKHQMLGVHYIQP